MVCGVALPTKLVILPSLSQVMSCRVARWVGFSSSLWMGMMGKSWSMAQRSGSDWNSEKLQKYLSASSFGSEVTFFF